MSLLRSILKKANLTRFSIVSRRYLSFRNEVNRYTQDGVIYLPGCFSKRWVDVVKCGIQKAFENPSELSEKLTTDGGNSVYFNDLLQWRNIDEFQEFVKYSPAAEIAATFMNEEEVAFYHEHVFIKESSNESAIPWHQDLPYYPIDGWQNCSIWMPVTPIKANSVQFVKGSHKWGKWFLPTYFETSENYIAKEDKHHNHYEAMPQIREEEHEILSWDMEPGDCLVFHMLAVHGSNKATSNISRRTLVTRWFGSDATFVRRPWETSPPVEPDDIAIGDLVKNQQEFPVYSTAKKTYVSGF